jgi:hypothetical protein
METAAVTPTNAKGGFRRWYKLILAIALLLLLALFAVMWLWSRAPVSFDVPTSASARAQQHGNKLVPGYATVSTMLSLSELMLNKSGGYISNDHLPPGVFLDDMPNFEFGVLSQIRVLSSSLRDEFSRSQTQSVEDKALSEAQPLYQSPNDRWIVPSTESQYRAANGYIEDYLKRLSDPTHPTAQFYTRADNLEAYLRQVEQRLGSLSQRLSASVVHERTNTDLANDPHAQQSTPTDAATLVQTPWRKIDDNFYEARGATFALLHILKAIQIDFAPVLKNKNADASLQQIVRELEETQNGIWSPVILNGSGFGLVANHSLVMANYITRANSQIADLRLLLQRG